MAASTYIPAPRLRLVGNAGVVRHLATAVPTPVVTPAMAPALRLVVTPRHRRDRLVALLAAGLLVALVVLAAAGAATAGSDVPEIAGQVVLQPGETLWDVAVRSAAPGVDPRRQMDALRQLNGFGPGALDPWTVVLIPAR
jgi:hypothetical protein